MKTLTDGWIQTFTGRRFYPLQPRFEDVCLIDIAHALSNICRFTGHTKTFYSVAQHSVLVSTLVGSDPLTQLWALLHDASEAYLCDIAKPVKPLLTGYVEAEERVMRVIAEKFDLGWPRPEIIHTADMQALATERRDLMGPCDVDRSSGQPPLEWKIERGALPEEAEQLFLGAARYYAEKL